DCMNIGAFLTLSIFGLCFQREPRRDAANTRRPALLRVLESRGIRVAGLMALVCAIEFVQLFIPGRVGELHDVCTGWSGIFAAWLIAVLFDARATRSSRAGYHAV
ncbi:MAG: VanZ family protein, partial [Chthoniobacteraceae bacterium]